jgi:alkylhydroperoxidase/carboxymuconolactone decarboxylase family protein YurZ
MIVRSPRPDNHFTTFANEILRDERLSYKARGILLELLSRPDNWRVSAEALANGKDGRDAVLSGLAELREVGYIVTTKRQEPNGQWVTESVVYDSPKLGFPKSEKPKSEKPKSENPTPLEETRKKKREETAYEPNGSQVKDLVTLYWDNFIGEIKPSPGQIAGHIQLALKRGAKPERLAEVLPVVAAEGKPCTINVITYAMAKVVEKPQVATPTPPRFVASDQQVGVPMPREVADFLKTFAKTGEI